MLRQQSPAGQVSNRQHSQVKQLHERAHRAYSLLGVRSRNHDLPWVLGLEGRLAVVVLLLVVAVRNTWDLVVTFADRPDAGATAALPQPT